MRINTTAPQEKNWPTQQSVVFSIPVTIALVLLIILGSAGVTLTVAFYRYEKEALRQYVRTQFTALAESLAPLVREAFQSKNYQLVQNTLETLIQHDEIAFAIVVDADSLIVASEPPNWQRRPLREFLSEKKLNLFEIPQPNSFTTRVSESSLEQHLFLFDRQFHEVRPNTPGVQPAVGLQGRLLLGYDNRFVEALVGDHLSHVLLLTSVIMLLGAIAFYLVVHIFLIRPLRSMGQVMRAVTDGNLNARCPNLAGLPEVASLIHQFNDMLAVRKMVEETLTHSEARFRSVIGAAQDAIIAVDQQQRLTLFNHAAERVFGHAAGDMIGQPFAQLFPPETTPQLANLIHREEMTTGQVHELQAQHRNGQQFPIELTIAPAGKTTSDAAEIVYIAVIRDVSAKKRVHEEMQRLQEQLFQAQKMETIGTLAGGVAHDFNNLLVGILGTASLMKMSIGQDSLLQEHIQTIEQASLRASELTKQLLGFARAGKYEVRAVNLNHPIEELQKLISRTFDKRVTLTVKLAKELWAIEGDSNQLQHSFLNICLNARDAMPHGGVVTLTTQNLDLDLATAAQHHNLAPGKYVHVAITDTGVGMDSATQARIFEPFFSTKERGKGTGLGLAMVYGIVRNHGGRIFVESALGKGSTFHIYLPATRTPVAAPQAESPLDTPFGSETILLIDDERVILDVASRILKRLGYTVLVTPDGQEGVRVFAERRHEIALVILDMVMPKLGGREVFRRLKAIDPQVRVLLSSGYSADGDTQAILNEGVLGFVQKPYVMNDLAQAVKRAIKLSSVRTAHPAELIN